MADVVLKRHCKLLSFFTIISIYSDDVIDTWEFFADAKETLW